MNATSNPVNEINTETLSVQKFSPVSRNRTVFRVYALCDPRTPTVPRYIGSTRNLSQRLRGHRSRATSAAAREWFNELSDLKLEACCIVLHEFDTEKEARIKEAELIATLPGLLNSAATLPTNLPEPPTGNSLADVELRHILQTIHKYGGNKLAAARALGIGRQTLYNKLAVNRD